MGDERVRERGGQKEIENIKNNQQQFITCIDLVTSIMINLAEY